VPTALGDRPLSFEKRCRTKNKCGPSGHFEILLAFIGKYPTRKWNYADIRKL
jgi:hypothetical protein